MNEAKCILEFLVLQKRCDAVGLTLKVSENYFDIHDAPKASGLIRYENLSQMSVFIRGYELSFPLPSLTTIAK